MKDAIGHAVTVSVGGAVHPPARTPSSPPPGGPSPSPASCKAYVEGTDDPDAELDDREQRLPQLAERDALTAESLTAHGHATKPPARYTEASLIKELEDRAIGRPSTYASIIGTIQDRGYVFKKGTALVPSFTAFAVVSLLEQHFGRLVDYELHRADGRGRWTTSPGARRRGCRGCAGSTSAPTARGPGPQGAGQRPERHRRPGGQLVPAERQRHRRACRALWSLP